MAATLTSKRQEEEGIRHLTLKRKTQNRRGRHPTERSKEVSRPLPRMIMERTEDEETESWKREDA